MVAIVYRGKGVYRDTYASVNYEFKPGEAVYIPDDAARLFFGFVFDQTGEVVRDEKAARRAAIRAGYGEHSVQEENGRCRVIPNRIAEFFRSFEAYAAEVSFHAPKMAAAAVK